MIPLNVPRTFRPAASAGRSWSRNARHRRSAMRPLAAPDGRARAPRAVRPLLGLSLIAGLAASASSSAQSWENPSFIRTPDSYTTVSNTCAQPQRYVGLSDGLYDVFAPATVYAIRQVPQGRWPAPRRSVLLHPAAGFDASLWVCTWIDGYSRAGGCVDGSDNEGAAMFEDVTVPSANGTYYLIVTKTVFAAQSSDCGAYLLDLGSIVTPVLPWP